MAVDFYQELKNTFRKNEPFVLCTVVETKGSSPGKMGQKMIVFANGKIVGTIGGGINEEKTRAAALELFKKGSARIITYDLANSIDGNDPVCGGVMRVFIELITQESQIIIFGAGHIGRVLAKMATLARFRVSIVDERPEFADESLFPDCDKVICSDYKKSFEQLAVDKNSYLIVVTPGHVNDREVLEVALKTEAKYVGLVSSAKKLVEMKKIMADSGVEKVRLESLFSPIGINLGSNTPEEIAVEILAQIVAFRNGKELRFER